MNQWKDSDEAGQTKLSNIRVALVHVGVYMDATTSVLSPLRAPSPHLISPRSSITSRLPRGPQYISAHISGRRTTIMSVLLSPVVELYRLALQPVAPFTWFGLTLSTLDVVATVRLCVALRQIREKLWRDHVQKTKTVRSEKETAVAVAEVEPRSFVRDAASVLLVVYGGEAVTCQCSLAFLSGGRMGR